MSVALTPRLGERLNNIYSELLDDVAQKRFVKRAGFSERASAGVGGRASAEITPLYSVQNLLRPLYGKGEPQPPDIGDHPDFRHLRGTDQQVYCPITTMFMDIESSTRLSLVYSLEDVQRIKNAFIRAAIEIIKSFDGHVHRIMGDAVLAYFGGECAKPEVGVIDGLNCAAFLRYFVEEAVIPRLSTEGYADPFGIRIGLDYGPKEKVLWSSYGYPGMEEVTATSFYVDVAAKLQHSAGRNQIMVGESIREFIDFPEELLGVKTVERGGVEVPEPFILPNHADRTGNPINYKKFRLNWLEYLACSPIAQLETKVAGTGTRPNTVPVKAELFSSKNGVFEGAYAPTGATVPKGKWLRFKVQLPYVPMLPYTIKCVVENHGTEAVTHGGSLRGNHQSVYDINTRFKHDNFEHWEHVAYRGLHYLIVEIHTHGQLKYKARFGVFGE